MSKMELYEKYKADKAFRRTLIRVHTYEKRNGTCYQYNVEGEDIYIRHNNDGSFTLVS